MKRGPKPSRFCKRGHDKDIVGIDTQSKCVACKKIDIKQWRERNKDRIQHYEELYINLNREKIKTRHQRYNQRHRKDINTWTANYRKEHPEMVRASNIKAATNRNLSIVPWTDWNNIHKIDKKCPDGMEVDHIIPLQNKSVMGLHVSWNLQYLTIHDNRTKRNKVNLLEVSERYGKILKEAGLK